MKPDSRVGSWQREQQGVKLDCSKGVVKPVNDVTPVLSPLVCARAQGDVFTSTLVKDPLT